MKFDDQHLIYALAVVRAADAYYRARNSDNPVLRSGTDMALRYTLDEYNKRYGETDK